MKNRWIVNTVRTALIVATGLFISPVLAGDDAASKTKDALKLIPADAMMFVSVPDMKTLDADLKRTFTDLELTESVGLPDGSLLAYLRANMPFFEHVDEDGSAAVFFMPASSIPEFQQKQVLMLTAKDADKLLEALNAQPAEDGTKTVALFGQPLHAMARDNHVYFASTGELAKTAVEATEGIDTKLQAEELDALAGMDVSMHMSDTFFKVVKTMADMFMPMMMQAQDADPFTAKSMEMNKKNIDMFFEGVAGMSVGLGLGADGFSGSMGMRIKPGSDLAKQYKLKTSDKPLVTGLPVGDYVFAFGGTVVREQMEVSFESLEPFFELTRDVEGLDQEKIGKLKDNFRELLLSMTGVHGVIESLKPDSGYLIGASMLIDTANSANFIKRIEDHVTESKALIADADEELIDAQVKKMVESITFDRDAAKVADADVSVLKVDLGEVEDLDEEEQEQLEAVLGDDGLTFRFAAVGDKQVAMTFGGGEEYLSRLIDSAKSGKAPLMEEKGVKLIMDRLPKEKSTVYIFAVDHGLALGQNIADALDEERLPLSNEPIDAPMGISITGSQGWMRGDMHVPTPLMKAVARMIRTMTGANAAPVTS